MRILHYTLGLYPNRTGGLNRYATDLIKEQSKNHQVTVLVPGQWKPWIRMCVISNKRNIRGINCYNLINALPQPLLYGIKSPRYFKNIPISIKSFELFYEIEKPEVLHLHTLMGLPEEALRFFKGKGVRIVYTSHDYFGICPKVNLINQKGELCVGPNAEHCEICNADAPGILFLRFRSSNLIFRIRNIVKWIRITIHF